LRLFSIAWTKRTGAAHCAAWSCWGRQLRQWSLPETSIAFSKEQDH